MTEPHRRPQRPPRPTATDATSEPEPGPPPEAVFDRLTGPYARRAPALVGARPSEET